MENEQINSLKKSLIALRNSLATVTERYSSIKTTIESTRPDLAPMLDALEPLSHLLEALEKAGKDLPDPAPNLDELKWTIQELKGIKACLEVLGPLQTAIDKLNTL